MKVTKYTIKTDKVFLFSCDNVQFTPAAEKGFKLWLVDYLKDLYPGRGMSIYTKYEYPVLSALVVVDINEGQEAPKEEIEIKA